MPGGKAAQKEQRKRMKVAGYGSQRNILKSNQKYRIRLEI